MDSIVVGIIVTGAVFFSVRSFIKTCKGEGDCSCGDNCSSCSSKRSCSSDVFIVNKK